MTILVILYLRLDSFVCSCSSARTNLKVGWGSGRKNRNFGNAGEPSGNWCMCPSTGGVFEGVQGITPGKFWNCIWKILQSSAFLAGKRFAMPSVMRYCYTLTTGTLFPCVPARVGHGLDPSMDRIHSWIGLDWIGLGKMDPCPTLVPAAFQQRERRSPSK